MYTYNYFVVDKGQTDKHNVDLANTMLTFVG